MAGIGNIGKLRINKVDDYDDDELTEDELQLVFDYFGVSTVDDLPWDEMREVKSRILDPDSDIPSDLTWEELKEICLY